MTERLASKNGLPSARQRAAEHVAETLVPLVPFGPVLDFIISDTPCPVEAKRKERRQQIASAIDRLETVLGIQLDAVPGAAEALTAFGCAAMAHGESNVLYSFVTGSDMVSLPAVTWTR